MNANTSDTESFIESALTEAVQAHRPPPGLKQAVAARLEIEQARLVRQPARGR